jgi:hypothetical protein
MGTGSFPGGKAAGAWRWPPTRSSSEVKERVELYFCSPSGPSWPILGWTVTSPFKEAEVSLLVAFTRAAAGPYSEPHPHLPFVCDEFGTISLNLEHIKSAVVSTLLTVDKQVERSAYHSHPLCRQIESFTVGIVNRPEVWDVHLPRLSTRDCVPLWSEAGASGSVCLHGHGSELLFECAWQQNSKVQHGYINGCHCAQSSPHPRKPFV